MAAILLYHSIGHEARVGRDQLSPQSLIRHLDWCRALGYEFVPLADALEFSAEKLVSVTFDDGLASVLRAWEALRSRKIQPTIFVCPGLIGLNNRWASPDHVRERLLDASELLRLSAEGVEFGCHGWDHRPFLGHDEAKVEAEIRLCSQWFEEELKIPARFFAWPFGRYDAIALRVIARSYRRALGVLPNWDAETHPWAVPRVVACDEMNAAAFEDELLLKSFTI